MDWEALDRSDPLRDVRALFQLEDGLIYLDGNSLGAMPRAVTERMKEALEHDWARDLARSWNGPGWLDAPTRVGDKIGGLIGAGPGQVLVSDSTSVNLFKLLVAALERSRPRQTVVTHVGNFPTDSYIADGVVRILSAESVRRVERDQIADAIDDDTAIVMVTHVDYRTGHMLDMDEVTRVAHDAGALVLWDLCHSAGALPVELDRCDADFAVGCTYKFLNGGPGAPAFLYIATRWQHELRNPIQGWLGHADTFAFAPDYEPAAGVERFLTGTPGILGITALEAAIDIWETIDIAAVREKSVQLGELLIDLTSDLDGEFGLRLASPRAREQRGSQVSFRHENAYEIVQALAARNVIVDHRPPDIVRVGLTPLYTRYVDIRDAAEILASEL